MGAVGFGAGGFGEQGEMFEIVLRRRSKCRIHIGCALRVGFHPFDDAIAVEEQAPITPQFPH